MVQQLSAGKMQPCPPTFRELQEKSIERWITLLIAKYSFRQHDRDPKCPYGAAMRIFQQFTNAVIDGLHDRSDDAIQLVATGSLHLLYTGMPSMFEDFGKFHRWVYEAIMKHPHRREPSQVHWLAIVEAQMRDDTTLSQKTEWAADQLLRWFAQSHQLENLKKDPDQLYVFRHQNGINPVNSQDEDCPEEADECQVCTERFDPPEGLLHASHSPQRAPCGHILCASCFRNWLDRSKGKYTCPLCRACLVCGANNCHFHTVPREPAIPLPVPLVLKLILGPSNDPLHGLSANQYWIIREKTRPNRSILGYYGRLLTQDGVLTNDPVYRHCVKHGDELWEKVKKVINEVAETEDQPEVSLSEAFEDLAIQETADGLQTEASEDEQVEGEDSASDIGQRAWMM